MVTPLTVSEGMQQTVVTYRALGLASLGALVLDGAYSALDFKLQRFTTLEATARAWLAAVLALQGSSGTVVEDGGTSRSNVLAISIVPMPGYQQIQKSTAISGIGSGWVATLRFLGAYLVKPTP